MLPCNAQDDNTVVSTSITATTVLLLFIAVPPMLENNAIVLLKFCDSIMHDDDDDDDDHDDYKINTDNDIAPLSDAHDNVPVSVLLVSTITALILPLLSVTLSIRNNKRQLNGSNKKNSNMCIN